MTGYTVHTGASKKFVSGWDKIFAGSSKPPATSKAAKKSEPEKAKKGKKK